MVKHGEKRNIWCITNRERAKRLRYFSIIVFFMDKFQILKLHFFYGGNTFHILNNIFNPKAKMQLMVHPTTPLALKMLTIELKGLSNYVVSAHPVQLSFWPHHNKKQVNAISLVTQYVNMMNNVFTSYIIRNWMILRHSEKIYIL